LCRSVFQMEGGTPLYMASQNGHAECVQALVAWGAAINKAKVGVARSIAELGCVEASSVAGEGIAPCVA
jgi:hypothetical protein